MKPLKINDVINAINGRISNSYNSNGFITGVSTDTRSINQGELFIPLKGENFDGHDFIPKAFSKGASFCLCNKNKIDKANKTQSDNIIIVEDTKIALIKLAKYYRELFPIPFIAVTGSVGKTTTKEMIAQVLNTKYNVLKTKGNFNNEIGLPHTLFRLNDRHNIGVVELGMSSFGEISKMADAVRPKIGVITNIGISHIENLGSKENIAKAKTELLDSMEDDDIVILNAESPELWKKRSLISQKTIYFGDNRGDVQIKNKKRHNDGSISFNISGKYGNNNFKIAIPGEHNVYNAVCAIIVGFEMNLSKEAIQEGLLKFNPPKMRQEFKKAYFGATVIDDSYNASPDSVRAALDLLAKSGKSKKKAVVLGDMLELGKYSKKAHFDIGLYAGNKVDIFIAVGDFAKDLAKGAEKGDVPIENIFTYRTTTEACKNIVDITCDCDIILVKASRALKMEKIIQRLTGRS